jgi:hypothetical protein
MNGYEEKGIKDQFEINISTKTLPANNGKERAEYQIASVKVGNIHLTVAPDHSGDAQNLHSGKMIITLWPDDHGKADFRNSLGAASIVASADDLLEVADTYARRLAGGATPENIFTDTEVKPREVFKNMIEKMKKKKS